MKLTSSKPLGAGALQRNRLLFERAKAPNLRAALPNLQWLSIELCFLDQEGQAPSPQRHLLYPGAAAFFRFTCPCAACDGDFDLAPFVTELMETSGRVSSAARSASGQMHCSGIRLRDRACARPCPIELSFRLSCRLTQTDALLVEAEGIPLRL